MLTYLLAVLAACANATSSVLQRKASRKAPRGQNLSPRLIWSLAHEPVWFGGILAIIAGFLLQATALGSGEIAVVEPVLVLELPATLILASFVFGTRMHKREWAATVAMSAGLAGILYFLTPTGGQTQHVSWYVWLTGIGVSLAFVAGMVAWGRRGPAGRQRKGEKKQGEGSSSQQAAVLAIAAGAAFGLTAALMKGTADTYTQGFGALFTNWELYGMIATGVLGFFLLQSAMNAGQLIAAQPGLTLTDPLVSILWGVLAFHEHIRGGWHAALAVVCGLVMAFAVVTLARSPLLSQADDGAEERQPVGALDRD
jgi:drug/metabolite transporter (DMT)-like permease